MVTLPLSSLLAILVSIGAIITALITIYKARSDAKDRIMHDGEKEQQQKQLMKDLDDIRKRTVALEQKSSCTDIDMAEIKKDLKYLVEAMQKLERRFESRLDSMPIGGD